MASITNTAEDVLNTIKEAVKEVTASTYPSCSNDRLTSALSRALSKAKKLTSIVTSSPMKRKCQELKPEDWEDVV